MQANVITDSDGGIFYTNLKWSFLQCGHYVYIFFRGSLKFNTSLRQHLFVYVLSYL